MITNIQTRQNDMYAGKTRVETVKKLDEFVREVYVRLTGLQHYFHT